MSRKAKKVDEVAHMRKGLRVSIYLDYNTYKFTATVFDENLSCDTLQEITNLVHNRFSAFDQYKWEPMIFVEEQTHEDITYTGKYNMRASVRLEFWRAELAQNPQKTEAMVERPFLVDGLTDQDLQVLAEQKTTKRNLLLIKQGRIKSNEEDRKSGHDVKSHWTRDGVRIPYTPQAWAALCLIRDRIEMAGRQLKDLVGQSGLHKKLESIGDRFKLLPPMTDE